LRAHALALIELPDAGAEGRLAGAEDVPSHTETRGILWLLFSTKARLTPGVPALNGRPVAVAAA